MILFKRSYIPKIFDDSKTATRRPSRHMVRRGGSYHIRTGFFDYLPEKIEVLELHTQGLGSMTNEDANRGLHQPRRVQRKVEDQSTEP